MKSNNYPNGEPVTKERIQEEPWYGDYQGMMEMACFDDFKDWHGLYERFAEDYADIHGRMLTKEEAERFERWAKCEFAKKQENANA